MRVVAIIQARMGSTRLPGKVMKDLGGATVLARVVNRTRRARLIDEVVVATTTAPGDDVIVDECRHLGVACFRGDENDVLDRYYQCARQFAADAVVRITSDCPLVDPELIDATVERFLEGKHDYVTNGVPDAGSPAKDPLPKLGWVLVNEKGEIVLGRGPKGEVEGTLLGHEKETLSVHIAKKYVEAMV